MPTETLLRPEKHLRMSRRLEGVLWAVPTGLQGI